MFPATFLKETKSRSQIGHIKSNPPDESSALRGTFLYVCVPNLSGQTDCFLGLLTGDVNIQYFVGSKMLCTDLYCGLLQLVDISSFSFSVFNCYISKGNKAFQTMREWQQILTFKVLKEWKISLKTCQMPLHMQWKWLSMT